MNEEDFGTPYSVAEARLTAQDHKNMDIYHKELILWLCNRIEELEKELKRKKRLTDEKDYKALYENLDKRISNLHSFANSFGGNNFRDEEIRRRLKRIAYGQPVKINSHEKGNRVC